MKALKLILSLTLITICLFPPAEALRAQTVSWTSSDETVATADETGLVTPVSEGTATITATITKNGKTITSSKTIEVNLGPPPITINGVKWAQGNVTFDPSSCTGGVCTRLAISSDPYERGLYFQWYGGTGSGALIGYPKGGDTTTGTAGNAWNVTPNVNDTSTWRYVQPGAAFPNTWLDQTTTGTVYHSYNTTKGEWTANNPCTLIGDGWRMPTKSELEYTHPSGTAAGSTSPNITGWTYSSAKGGYLQHIATGLTFTFAGYRAYNSFTNQGTRGHYWSSTEYSSRTAYLLNPTSSGLNVIGNSYYKSDANSVRCVKD